MDYRQTAYEVMKLFLTDYTETELKNCINAAYDNKFDTEEICELRKKQMMRISLNFSTGVPCFQRYGFIDTSTSTYSCSKKNDMKKK